MTVHRFIVVALLVAASAMLGFPRPGLAADRVALVIGNGAYAPAPTLSNPPNDARDVAAALRAIGFDVDFRIDSSRDDMAAAIARFADRARNADVALFFYAGHGVQAEGENYLIPVDARIDSQATLGLQTIDLSKLQDAMTDGASVRIIILDACRNNPFVDATHRGIGGSRGLSPMDTRAAGSLIIYSTQPNTVAADGKGRNSPFTAALLRHIGTRGLEIRQMMSRVRKDVVDATGGQIPWDNSSLIGDVYLAGPESSTAIIAPSPPAPLPPASPPTDPCADASTETILAPVRQLFAALQALDLSLYADQWANDAIYVNSRTGESRDRAGIVAAKRSGFARWSRVSVGLPQRPTIVSRSGREARIEDTYSISIVSGGRALPPDVGHEAYRVRCEDDGRWRITRNDDYLE
ncbi:MAG: caspase family protein [Roseiarcus sp.]